MLGLNLKLTTLAVMIINRLAAAVGLVPGQLDFSGPDNTALLALFEDI